MKHASKVAVAVVAALGLGAGAALACPMGGETGGAGHGSGHKMGGTGQGHGHMMGGTDHGPGHMMGGTGYGPRGKAGGPGAQLMTPEERTAFRDKMRAAKTPEERQTLAEANHAQMQKRAEEKGITLPERPAAGSGRGSMHRH